MKQVAILNFLFMLLCIGSIFIYSYQFTDPHIITKWCFATAIVLMGSLYCSIKTLFNRPVKINILVFGAIIFITCFIQAVYGIYQYIGLSTSFSIYEVAGSFDNPAGFAACLCAGLPFIGVFLSENRNRYIRYAGWCMGFVIVAAVVCSELRSGIISIIVISFVWICKNRRIRLPYRLLLFCSLFILLVVVYLAKKDSADGRLLIWQCGLNMVKEAPWFGHGIGSFEAHYMDFQADYFRKYPQSYYSMLAGNVKRPFNEYLGILLNFGIIGLLMLAAVISFLIYCYQKKSDKEKLPAFYSLLSIGFFALFSYPFTYPFVWIVMLFCVYILIKEYLCLFSYAWIRTVGSLFILTCSLLFSYKLFLRIQMEREWSKASNLVLCRQTEKAFPCYKKLEHTFNDNPYFLYNYAAIFFQNKQFNESLHIALNCRRYWADYDLELMIGEIYQNLNNPFLAEKYYCNAVLMCPSRFTPLYLLYKLYKETGNTEHARKMAETIINKPMKIKSSRILQMKREMRKEKE